MSAPSILQYEFYRESRGCLFVVDFRMIAAAETAVAVSMGAFMQQLVPRPVETRCAAVPGVLAHPEVEAAAEFRFFLLGAAAATERGGPTGTGVAVCCAAV